MIVDVHISEKSFGPKSLMKNIKFSVDNGEKVGIIGRNGIGKSTLFAIMSGIDKDYSGEVTYHRGTVVVTTAQEHHNLGDITVLQYILKGLPEYSQLVQIIQTYPITMGDDMKKITTYTEALQRFDDKGFYTIEDQIKQELEQFQLGDIGQRAFKTLSGGQKRLVEVVKIMHADADLALVDEPTNHMDYIAKAQFIDWLKATKRAVLVVTHDRDVLEQVDRIIELKDGENVSYRGNYDDYLRQNAVATGSQMNEFEMIAKRINNLKTKVLDYQRLKEKSRNPSTIQKFKRLENQSRAELAELQAKEKPTFWIDKNSVENLNYKVASQYDKFKTRNVKINLKDGELRSRRALLSARDLSLGYGTTALFEHLSFDLREGEALELRGRNGAGKSTLIHFLLAERQKLKNEIVCFAGEASIDRQVRLGIYEQEISSTYFELPLKQAIEQLFLDRDLPISETKIRRLMHDYLFIESDGTIPIERLSGGQKARFQMISMLANDPQLLILDEPTNHLDLPSIEELETALAKYTGAVLYVSHDGYFRKALPGQTVLVGKQ